MLHQIQLTCPLHDSFRVQQIAGMFDVPVAEKLHEQFAIDLPVDLLSATAHCPPSTAHCPWRLGLITGPSASGKTTLARQLFGPKFIERINWQRDKAIIDCFDESSSIHEITKLLTAVGLSSPPTWIKPHHVLSTGEQFRANLARTLHVAASATADANASSPPTAYSLPPTPLIAFDEFTSTLDRRVAHIVSMALAKAIRTNQIPCRFVAITCHEDITNWLCPDWIINMGRREFEWCDIDPGHASHSSSPPTAYSLPPTAPRRRLQRPPITLEIHRCHPSAWQTFARHHYLSGKLNRSARCYIALWCEQCQNIKSPAYPFARSPAHPPLPVSFCATLPLIGRKNRWRISRIVTLPDYQGIGIGTRFMEAVADLHQADGHRINITASHPALIAHCRRSPLWRAIKIRRIGSKPHRRINSYLGSPNRPVVSFEYVADPGGTPGVRDGRDRMHRPPDATPFAKPQGVPPDRLLCPKGATYVSPGQRPGSSRA